MCSPLTDSKCVSPERRIASASSSLTAGLVAGGERRRDSARRARAARRGCARRAGRAARRARRRAPARPRSTGPIARARPRRCRANQASRAKSWPPGSAIGGGGWSRALTPDPRALRRVPSGASLAGSDTRSAAAVAPAGAKRQPQIALGDELLDPLDPRLEHGDHRPLEPRRGDPRRCAPRSARTPRPAPARRPAARGPAAPAPTPRPPSAIAQRQDDERRPIAPGPAATATPRCRRRRRRRTTGAIARARLRERLRCGFGAAAQCAQEKRAGACSSGASSMLGALTHVHRARQNKGKRA